MVDVSGDGRGGSMHCSFYLNNATVEPLKCVLPEMQNLYIQDMSC